MTPLGDILRAFGIEIHVYSDAHQMYLSFQPIDKNSADVIVNNIQTCMVDVKQWIVQHMLKLNNHKAEIIAIGTRQQRSKIGIPHININGSDIAPTSTIRNLGILLDSEHGEIRMKAHVSSFNSLTYLQLKNIRAIKSFSRYGTP